MALQEKPKTAKEAQETMNESVQQIQEIAQSLSGMGVFAIVEKLHEWARDDFPERGMWAHVSEIPDIFAKYNSSITFEFLDDLGNLDWEKAKDLLIAIIKLPFRIASKIISQLIQAFMLILKMMYDACQLFLDSITKILNDLVAVIRNFMYFIHDLLVYLNDIIDFLNEEDEDDEGVWDKICKKIQKAWDDFWSRETWDKFLDWVIDMLKIILGPYIALFEYYWDLIKKMWDRIKEYWEQIKNIDKVLSKVLEDILNKYFNPILDMIKDIIAMFMNMSKTYILINKGVNEYQFIFTSDTIKDSEGVFVNINSTINTLDPSKTVTYSYVKDDETVRGTCKYTSFDISVNDEEKLTVSVNIPNFLKSKSLISTTTVNPNNLSGIAVELEEDKSMFDIWELIDQMIEYKDKMVALIIKKLKEALNLLFEPIQKVFIPHTLFKEGSSNEGIPKVLDGYKLCYPSLAYTFEESETPKVLEIVSVSGVLDVNSQLNAVFKPNWKKDKCNGTIKKNGDKIIFIGQDINRDPLYYFASCGESVWLITEYQKEVLDNLKKILKIPIYTFNTAALAITTIIYLSNFIPIQAMKAIGSAASAIGLSFMDVLKTYGLAGENEVTFKEFVSQLGKNISWPTEWKEFDGNPFDAVDWTLCPPDFVPKALRAKFGKEENKEESKEESTKKD